MKIGIDASRYSHELATGVEWYSWHIINALTAMVSRQDELILYSKKNLNLKARNIVLPAKRLWTLWALTREMRKNPPDVLFVPSHTLPLSLPKRSVITIHDTAFKYLKKSYSFLQYHYLNWSTKYAVKHATKIIVPSTSTARDLENFFNCKPEKIVVIPHGYEKPRAIHEDVFTTSPIFKYFRITRELPYILFVGRLESKKNLSRLVEAFHKFSQKFPKYKLILAGKRGIGFNDILRKVNELELMHKVIMPGYITEHEKAALYKYAKIIALPSLYEGFGLPLLEAFYYGKPVLCSNVSSLPEVAGDAVCYCDPYDSVSIADGLKSLAEGGAYVEELVSKGIARLKQFSWKDAAEKTLKTLHGQ